MSDPLPPGPPAWVRKRDGSLVPFEADKISRALFAATEGLGRPDAFLARELTDGVVHFLADEGGSIPDTADIAELVVKTVRELGQPLLARAFVEYRESRRQPAPETVPPEAPSVPGARPPRPVRPARTREVELRVPAETPLAEVLAECTRQYTLQTVFARDVVSIHSDGLLTLTGLDTPGELAGCVLPGLSPPEGDGGLVEALRQLRQHTGQVVVLDGPEHHLAQASREHPRPEDDAGAVARLVRELEQGLRLTGLRAVVNLNAALPPSSLDDLAGGPLFAGQRTNPEPETLVELADALLDRLARLPQAPGSLRIDWHLAERDFVPESRARERLLRVAGLLLASGGCEPPVAPVACVFDRPRRPVPLAEGINRPHQAVLLQVGLHLPRLAVQTGTTADTGRFLQKLGSLARLALSAGVQKRAYLRRPALARGFLLDRARLLVTPIGLDAVVRTLTGKGLCAGGAALELGRQVVQRLRDVLRQDGRAARLEACLDGPASFTLGGQGVEASEDVAGVTAWESAAGLKNQWRAAGVLHGVAEHGTLALFAPAPQGMTVEQVAECLQTIWQQTEVTRLRLLPAPRHA
jgi:hypothetical protein